MIDKIQLSTRICIAVIVTVLAAGAMAAAAFALVDVTWIDEIVRRSADGAKRLEFMNLDQVKGMQARAGIVAGLFAGTAFLVIKFGPLHIVSVLRELRLGSRRCGEPHWITIKANWYFLTLVSVLFAFTIIVYMDQPMRTDESLTYLRFGTTNPLVSLGYYSFANNHIFHSLLMRASIAVYGEAPWAIRLPAATASIITIPAIYIATQVMFSRQTAVVSSVLFAGSAYALDSATNARGYTLIILAFFIGTSLIPNILRGKHTALASFVIVSALGLWSVPVMVLPLSIEVCCLFLGALFWVSNNERPAAIRACIAAAIGTGLSVLLLYAPTFIATPLSDSEVASLIDQSTRVDWVYRFEKLALNFVYAWDQWIYPLPFWAGIGATIVALFGFVVSLISGPVLTRLFAIATLVGPVSILCAIGLPTLPYWSFGFIFPIFLIFLAKGVLVPVGRHNYADRNKLQLSALAVTIVGIIGTVYTRYPNGFPHYVGYIDAEQVARYTYSMVDEKVRFIAPGSHLPPINFYLHQLGGGRNTRADLWSSESPDNVFVVLDPSPSLLQDRPEATATLMEWHRDIAQRYMLKNRLMLNNSELLHYVPPGRTQ